MISSSVPLSPQSPEPFDGSGLVGEVGEGTDGRVQLLLGKQGGTLRTPRIVLGGGPTLDAGQRLLNDADDERFDPLADDLDPPPLLGRAKALLSSATLADNPNGDHRERPYFTLSIGCPQPGYLAP